MKNRIKFLSALLFVCFLMSVVHTIYQESDSFKLGFELGRSCANVDNGKASKIDIGSNSLYNEAFVKSKKDLFSSFKKEQNLKTDGTVLCSPLQMIVMVDPSDVPHFLWYWIAGMFFAFSILVIYVMIPILFLELVRSSIKGLFLESVFIHRVRKLGLLFILLSFCSFFCSLSQFLPLYLSVELEEYTFSWRSIEVGWYVFLGLILFFIAEVLNISLKMKEEQDLTI